jgi:hypothetical protein
MTDKTNNQLHDLLMEVWASLENHATDQAEQIHAVKTELADLKEGQRRLMAVLRDIEMLLHRQANPRPSRPTHDGDIVGGWNR